MAGFRRPKVAREQFVLWSQRLDDAIPCDHPVRSFDQLMNSEAFAETFREWEQAYVCKEGQPPYHPRVLAGLYLYGMLNRIRSSRQLESASHNRLDVIWLLSGETPDHSTIAPFVTDHAKSLRKLFRDVLTVGLKAGLIKLEHVATDGTKIEADAGRGSVRSEEKIRSWLGHVDEKIAALEAEWEKNERQETTLLGDRAPWAPPGDRSEKQRLAAMQSQQTRLKKALAELSRRQEESAGNKPVKAIASTTDPTSRSMKDKEGRVKPNYNAQLAVDVSAGMVVACEVNDAAEDTGQLTLMLQQVEANCGAKPAVASADSGYNTGPELAKLEAEGIVAYLPDARTSGPTTAHSKVEAEAVAAQAQALVAAQAGQSLTDEQWKALPRDATGHLDKTTFTYDATNDSYRCPAGQSLPVLRNSRYTKKWGVAERKQYGFASNPPCAQCLQATACCAQPARGRTISRDQYEEYRERLRKRMAGETGLAIYKRRRETAEPRIGHIKQGLGVRRFLHRGVEKVRAEWTLVCTAINLSILLRHWKEVAAVL
jgi:transposase